MHFWCSRDLPGLLEHTVLRIASVIAGAQSATMQRGVQLSGAFGVISMLSNKTTLSYCVNK